MNKIVVCIVLSSLFFACASKNQTPTGVIPKEKMVALLIDIEIAEATINERRYAIYDTGKAAYYKMEAQIFKKHQTDSSKYRRSMQFYSKNLAVMEGIYTTVLDSLNFREAVAKSKNKKKEAKKKNTKKKKAEKKNTKNKSMWNSFFVDGK
jgi:hypothetical protein